MIEPTIRIDTPDSLDYHYFPITRTHLNISVKAPHDARICLRNNLTEDSDFYEITIGGWGNTMSAIKKNSQEPDVAEANTPGILSDDDMCFLFVQWNCDGYLIISRDDEESNFMKYHDREPFVINYIGLSTAWGARGEWIFDGSHITAPAVKQHLIDTNKYWCDFDENYGMPQNAVPAHEDGLYIGRCRYKRSVTPGGVRDTSCSITWGGHVFETSNFQVFCDKQVEWVKSFHGCVPLYAIPAGETEDGHALFVGRVQHNGLFRLGKIQSNHQVCYIPLHGQEVPFTEYEALVVKDYPVHELVGR